MIKCCNCEKVFETENDLSYIVEKPNLSTANGTRPTWHSTDRFAMQGPVPEDTKTVRYEVFKGCPNCIGDEYLMEI